MKLILDYNNIPFVAILFELGRKSFGKIQISLLRINEGRDIDMSTILYNTIISPLEFIIEILFSIFYYIFQLDLGSSIFFISFSVTLMCLPFYYRADKIKKEEEDKLLQLEPFINKIKRNFKGDEQFFMLKTLYRQNNYNPIMSLRNSISLLLQIPFFIAAYHFFSNFELFDGYSWLVFNDLSKPDGLLNCCGFKINILPFIMTIINIISTELYIKTNGFKNRIQSYALALFFLVVLYDSPSALVIYWSFNNLFYLLKNKFMNDKEPLTFVYKLSAFMLLFFVICYITDIQYLFSIVIKMLQTLSPYLIIFMVLKYRKDCYKDFDNILDYSTKKLFVIFLLCSFGLILIQGVLIPVGLLTSDLNMFERELGDTSNITKFIINNLYTLIGLYFFWGATVFYLLNKENRALFIFIFIIIYLFSLFNFLNFGSNLGTIDTNFRLESLESLEKLSGNIYSQLANLGVFLFIITLTWYLIKKHYLKYIVIGGIVLLLSETIVSGIFLSRYYDGITYINNINKTTNLLSDSNYIRFTKNHKNVIVLFVDRFLGILLPKILDEKPELKKVYSGFVFYPNTVSFAINTVLGYPPCIGGYEYTPINMDKDNRNIQDKWLESSLMLMTLFKNNNYLATVVDPIGDNDPFMRFYDNSNYSNIYSSKNMNYIKMAGKYNTKFRNDVLKDSEMNDKIQKRLYIYTFLNIAPKNLKRFVYNDGYYLLAERNQNLIYFYYFSENSVISAYTSLLYLKNITKFDSDQNTFTLIHNDLTHCFHFFQYPSYKYIKPITNIGINKFNDDYSFMAYHTAMATTLLIGEYLDYLKHSGVYDNSRIIIVSDHGNKEFKYPHSTKFEKEKLYPFNPLLLVKDFNQQSDLKIDNTFMTNADVPWIAANNLIENAKNPFTGEKLNKDEKNNGVKIYKSVNFWNTSHFTSNRVILEKEPNIMFVKENIFNENNWEDLKY